MQPAKLSVSSISDTCVIMNVANVVAYVCTALLTKGEKDTTPMATVFAGLSS